MAGNSTPGVLLTADQWDELCAQTVAKPMTPMDEDEDEDVDAVTGEDEDEDEDEDEEGKDRKRTRF